VHTGVDVAGQSASHQPLRRSAAPSVARTSREQDALRLGGLLRPGGGARDSVWIRPARRHAPKRAGHGLRFLFGRLGHARGLGALLGAPKLDGDGCDGWCPLPCHPRACVIDTRVRASRVRGRASACSARGPALPDRFLAAVQLPGMKQPGSRHSGDDTRRRQDKGAGSATRNDTSAKPMPRSMSTSTSVVPHALQTASVMPPVSTSTLTAPVECRRRQTSAATRSAAGKPSAMSIGPATMTAKPAVQATSR